MWIKHRGSRACQHIASAFFSSPILTLSLVSTCRRFTLTPRWALLASGTDPVTKEQELIYAQSRRERLLHTSWSRLSDRPTVEALLARGGGGIGAQRR